MSLQDPWQTSISERREFPGGHCYLGMNWVEEPGNLRDGEIYDIDGGFYVPSQEDYQGQSSTDLFEQPLHSWMQLDCFPELQYASPTYHEPNVDMITPGCSPVSYLQDWRKEPKTKLSIASTDTEYSVEEEYQRHVCHECNKTFKNLQELDQHAKKPQIQHRAWKCAEPSCGKTYARRDTFLRHRATHKDKIHACPYCSRPDKRKVFTRKDHLKEHIRNCHPKSTNAKSLDGARSKGIDSSIGRADPGVKGETAGISVVKLEDSKMLAMESLVKSLHTVMGNNDILGQLKQSLTTLSEPEMQKVASSMAKAALDETRESSSGGGFSGS